MSRGVTAPLGLRLLHLTPSVSFGVHRPFFMKHNAEAEAIDLLVEVRA